MFFKYIGGFGSAGIGYYLGGGPAVQAGPEWYIPIAVAFGGLFIGGFIGTAIDDYIENAPERSSRRSRNSISTKGAEPEIARELVTGRLLDQGDKLFESGDYLGSADLFRKAFEMGDDRAIVYEAIIKSYYLGGKEDESLELIRKGAKMFPDSDRIKTVGKIVMQRRANKLKDETKEEEASRFIEESNRIFDNDIPQLQVEEEKYLRRVFV